MAEKVLVLSVMLMPIGNWRRRTPKGMRLLCKVYPDAN